MNQTNKGLWGSMSSLHQCVTRAIRVSDSPEALEVANDLDSALQQNRSTFISLLRIPRKNSGERSSLQYAIHEPVAIPGFSQPSKVPEAFVQEALIISDMFDMSEFSAFSLLRSAEEEKTLYPGIPRGLIAVLFYYDSREHLASAFKILVQARQGISWTLTPNNEELASTITRFLDSILNNSLLDRILELVNTMDLTKELELLQRNRALGDAKHRSLVIEKFKSVRLLLAESIYCWSAQTPLRRDEVKRLMAHLSKVKLTETKDGSLDPVNLALLFALLYSLDISNLTSCEDITDSISQMPITNDTNFLLEVHEELKNGNWQSDGLLSIARLAWCVTLSALRQLPVDLQIHGKEAILDDDELMLDKALKGKVFKFIETSILSESNLPLETFYAQRLHSIIAEFMSHLFDRVKLMKSLADENARKILAHVREGLEPPQVVEQPYEDLLLCLSVLYGNRQCGEAVEEYWCDTLYSMQSRAGQSNNRQVALHRFVRLPGDFLLPSLFGPYLSFLSAISTTAVGAQSVYNFLRMNGQPASQGSNLSWDSFLSAFSNYYNNLRLQHPQSMHDTVYRSNRSPLLHISPQELHGLNVVLKLIENVAKNDEASRISLCDNTSWSPILVLTGLLTCNVPLSLKTGVLRVMSAFSLSPSLASRVWQAIQAANLVPPVDGTPGYTSRGLRQDIEEIETSTEQFPLSQAFLHLVLTLIKAGIPYQAGNLSSSSFKPYFDLIKEKIFLPHDSRTYRRGGEKWALAKMTLEIFVQLLKDYQKAPSSSKPSESWNHPSHTILLDMLNDSRLLRHILSILHDSVQILESYQTLDGDKEMKDSLLLILDLILKTHQLQTFAIKKSSGDTILMGIECLLQTVNPRSGMCDHMLNISKILNHHSTLPSHASFACNIITTVGSTSSGQEHLIPLLAVIPNATSFRQSFVQLLDHATLDIEHLEAAGSALNLLKVFLFMPSPNLAHFLLGFTDGNSLGNTSLRSDLLEPGVRGFPRTALHSILSCLPTFSPSLSQTSYFLLHNLSSHISTSNQMLRYLSSHDFIHQSLMNLPRTPADEHLMSIGWVLRIAALDLRYHSQHKQRSQLKRLISLMVSESPDTEGLSLVNSENHTSLWGSTNDGSTQQSRGILLSLLEMAELRVEDPNPLRCQFINQANKLIEACESIRDGIKVVDLSMLHQLLYQLIHDSNRGLSTNDPVEAEIQEVLDYGLSLNQARRTVVAQRHFLESWRQLVEVVVAVSPPELTERYSHQTFLHNLTLELTRRLLDESAMQELSSILVSTLLSLVTMLRTLHTHVPTHIYNYSGSDTLSKVSQLPSSLQLILRGILDCLLLFKRSAQSVRASLYASLLNYLHIHSDTPMSVDSVSVLPTLQAPPKESVLEQFHRENFEALRDDLPSLVDVLSLEASNGHIICRLLALSLLDSLSMLEKRVSHGHSLEISSPLLAHLGEHGHLRRLLEDLGRDDQNLIELINKGGNDLRPLYLWEARTSLLSRLALCTSGARLLLQTGLMTKLSEMQVFRWMPPEPQDETGGGQISQICGSSLANAMRICMAIITALPADESAISQVLLFISSNADSVAEGLRVPKLATSSLLHQLSLLTSVIASSSPPAVKRDLGDPSAMQISAETGRLRRHLLSLLPHFLPNEKLGKLVDELPCIAEDGLSVREICRKSLLTIFSNCLTHARDLFLQSQCSVLLFQPCWDFNVLNKGQIAKGVRPLSLGMLAEALNQAADNFMKARDSRDKATKNLNEIDNLYFDDLKPFVAPSLVASASLAAVRKLATIYLHNLVQTHTRQEEVCVHAVEAAMLLLYRHMESYLKQHVVPQTSEISHNFHNLSSNRLQNIPKTVSSPRSSHSFLGASLNSSISSANPQLTAAETSNLKMRAKTTVADILPKVEQVQSLYSNRNSHVPFLEGCISRIKWMIAE